jgi:phosphate acetyltransferase
MGLAKSFYFFQDGVLVVTTADRSDIVLAASMAALNGVKLAGLVLCGRYEPDPNLLILCERAFAQGLPIMTVGADMYGVVGAISNYQKSVTIDEWENAKTVFESVATTVDLPWLGDVLSAYREHRISGPEFRTRVINSARRIANKKIILPEGTEPRTIRAAVIVYQRQIAEPILLGDPEVIHRVASEQGLVLPPGMPIINPATVLEKYVQPLYELRKEKGLTIEQARVLLQDTVWLGTMMLKVGDVDGLVSGAEHTTADTVKPALQIVKMAPGFKLASSIFFMCLPNQVLVYGDCAINQNPNAEELADIAIQSADSAKAFGIPPRVAMISYSSGTSGHGVDVEKVRKATEIVKERRPDILIDGPMQYDAATTESVGRQKMPGSLVAGRATVLVFPDLNTGNTTYKAVQRSTNTVSVGPMLQGLAKPVNDLSRGALVDDIIYTIAITAIQAGAAV